jgi:hypothetical protein
VTQVLNELEGLAARSAPSTRCFTASTWEPGPLTMCVCVCVCVHTYIHTHMYIHTHTHIHTHVNTYTYRWWTSWGSRARA